MWDLSSLTRDWTSALVCRGSSESWPLDRQGSPEFGVFNMRNWRTNSILCSAMELHQTSMVFYLLHFFQECSIFDVVLMVMCLLRSLWNSGMCVSSEFLYCRLPSGRCGLCCPETILMFTSHVLKWLLQAGYRAKCYRWNTTCVLCGERSLGETDKAMLQHSGLTGLGGATETQAWSS